jgi:hypothetical protein
LSAGAALSAICAVAKGRSIGTIPDKEHDSQPQYKPKSNHDVEEIKVVHVRLKVKDGLALVGSDAKGKAANEEALEEKLGEGGYQRVKGIFEEVLDTWKGAEEELNEKGFAMYEQFRPEVKAGQKGWGRIGELNMEKIREVVKR